jgi:hypothetical protein
MKKPIGLFVLALSLLFAEIESYANWSAPVYIDSVSFSPFLPQVAARNDSIFVLYSDYGFDSGNNKFVRSVDGGNTWTNRFVLPHGEAPEYANFKIAGDTLVIFYTFEQFPYTHHFTFSTNFGESWGYIRNVIYPFWVYEESFDYAGPIATMCGAALTPDGNNYSIVLKESNDFGESWPDSDVVFTYGGTSAIPCFYYFYGLPFIITAGYLDYFGRSRMQLFEKISPDSSWLIYGPFGPAGDEPEQNMDASSDGHMAFVFQDLNSWLYDRSHIFISTSSDYGHTWSDLSDISVANFNFRPRIAVSYDTIAILFDAITDTVTNSSTLLLKKSYDFGLSWQPTEFIADSARTGDIQIDNGELHIIYEKYALNHLNLFYRRWQPESQGIEEAQKAKDLFLLSNYPNPFNAATLISYRLDKPGPVNLAIYDILGRKIETLIDSEEEAGYHEIIWDAGEFSSGLYFYKITAGGYSNIKKMLLVK